MKLKLAYQTQNAGALFRTRERFQVANQVSRIPGYPVSKEAAERIYCGLGEKNWWKQLYDGRFHHLGPEVFDQGLHGYEKEPGFYKSALKAFHYAKSHLKERLTVRFYKKLHQIACSHFDGQRTRTQIKASETGQFRNGQSSGVICKMKFSVLLDVVERKSDIKDPRRKTIIEDYDALSTTYNNPGIWKGKFTITPDEAQNIETIIQKQLKDVRATLAVWNQDQIMKHIAPNVSIKEDRFFIRYRKTSSEFSFEVVISSLFSKFNSDLNEIDAQIIRSVGKKVSDLAHQKLVLIGRLYYALEWGHPYPDGQGRTDLLLLAKLLSENGFTPAILDEPYMSSFSSEEDWIAYLEEGMQKWQSEAPEAPRELIFNEQDDADYSSVFKTLCTLSQDLKIFDPTSFSV